MDAFRNIKSSAFDMKNLIMAKDDTEKRVFEALANVNWNASTSLLNEISRDSFDYEKYPRIMKILWSALDDTSNWRSVFKSLTLLDYLVKNGNERVVEECRTHMYTLRSLEDFNYFENTIDRGVGVREKAKQLRSLITDNEQIREERQRAREIREKLANVSSSNVSSMSGFGGGSYSNSSSNFSGFGNSSYDHRSSRYGNSDMGNSSFNDNRGYGRYSDETSSREKQSTFNDSRVDSRRQTTDDDSQNRSLSPPKISSKKIEVKLRDKPRTSTASAPTSSTISTSKGLTPPKPTQNQPDLLSTDMLSPSSDFDPFSTSTTTKNSVTTGFDVFDSSTQITKSSSIDPFSTQSSSDQFGFSSFQPFQSVTPQQTQQQLNFGFDANFGNTSFSQQSTQLPLNLFSQPNQNSSFTNQMGSIGFPNQHSDFGDFQSSTTQLQPLQQSIQFQQQLIQSQKKDDLGGLVNLSSLELNKPKDVKSGQSSKTSKTDYSDHSSFHGLDGFSSKSTTSNSMNGLGMIGGQSYNYGNYSMGQQSTINRTQIPLGQLSAGTSQNRQPMGNIMGGSAAMKNPTTSTPPMGSSTFNPFPIGGNNNSSSAFNPFPSQTAPQQGNSFQFPPQNNFGF